MEEKRTAVNKETQGKVKPLLGTSGEEPILKYMSLIHDMIDTAAESYKYIPSMLRFRDKVEFNKAFGNYIYIVHSKLQINGLVAGRIDISANTHKERRMLVIVSEFSPSSYLEYERGLKLFGFNGLSPDLYDDPDSKFGDITKKNFVKHSISFKIQPMEKQEEKFVKGFPDIKNWEIIRLIVSRIYHALPDWEKEHFSIFVKSFFLYPWKNIPKKYDTEGHVVGVWVDERAVGL